MSFPPSVLARAQPVRLLVLDVDGVLTDGRLYYSSGGEELKAFCTQDGAAIKMLMGVGVDVAIISGRHSEAVARRALELGVTHLHQGANDKVVALEVLAGASGIEPSRMAHVGDDLPDLPIFNRVALRVSVPAAHPLVKRRADYVTVARAGEGAVREVCELLMHAQGTWEHAVAAFDR